MVCQLQPAYCRYRLKASEEEAKKEEYSDRRTCIVMRTSSRAELGAKLRRDQTRCVAAVRRCGPWCAAVVVVLGLGATARAQNATAAKDDLPDAPSAQMSQSAGTEAQSQVTPSDGSDPEGMTKVPMRPCKDSDYTVNNMPLQGPPPCIPENPIAPFVTSMHVEPLSSRQKGLLAIRDFMDPFNFLTIAGYSAIATAADPHSPYGPGVKGFAKQTGYGLLQDAQGEFFQTYVISSLAHQDPRYHRIPTASVKRRLWHAFSHTYVSQHDDGRPMPNYATLGTYFISAELSNLYVPGIQTDARSTARRIGIGIAADPAGAIVAEFLPDVARRIHIKIVFVQQILNQAMVGAPNVQ
jgi:hypothetical protein